MLLAAREGGGGRLAALP